MVPVPRIYPGEMLREEYILPLGLTADALAARTGLGVEHIGRITAELDGISPDVAPRLGAAFGQSPQMWLRMQAIFDRGAV